MHAFTPGRITAEGGCATFAEGGCATFAKGDKHRYTPLRSSHPPPYNPSHMSRNGKVIVAMSGGVDSSVAACLLKEQGYECVGVFMRVGAQHAEPESCAPDSSNDDAGATAPPRRFKHGCCSASDALDARAIAGKLGIPFYALNFEKDFERIIDYFVDEYERARTPNPCVMCNIQLKFGKLLRYADMMDAEFVATGHYARIVEHDGRSRLARSANLAKDQTYVLFGIRPGDLGRCMFPLGEMTDKDQVRSIAADLGLRVHDKPDSQEICFVPDNDYRGLVRRRRPDSQRPGEIVDLDGNVLATHEGLGGYTIGQRRGLGIAAGTPIYVTRLDLLSNTVTVGPRDALRSTGLVADRMNWHVDPPDGDGDSDAQARAPRVEIKIRHMHAAAPGTLLAASNSESRAIFDTPQLAVTPGQAAVYYDEAGLVLGGGWIRESPADAVFSRAGSTRR